MIRGKFITIEGTEGAGKSTALHFIENHLTQAGKKIISTREPGGTPISEAIRQILLYPANSEKLQPETELLLMFAGRSQHLSHCILPALQAGNWVVSDRFIDATYAYQGGGRGINLHHIATLDKLIVGNVYPDLTLLLDVPADIGVARTDNRGNAKDRIEQEKIDFFIRVRNVYLERAKQNSERIKIIDASQSLEKVEAQLVKVLNEFLSK